MSEVAALVIRLFFPSAERFCDFGGGNGLFVRLMRDAGYGFAWQDKYASNQFSRGHEAKPGDTYDLMTAFEVLEHLEDPHAFLEEITTQSPALLATTNLLPNDAPLPTDWWYYTLATGQHISFPTRRGIHSLAGAHGLQVTSANGVHLLARRQVSARLFRAATKPSVSRAAAGWSSRDSLLSSDYGALCETVPAG